MRGLKLVSAGVAVAAFAITVGLATAGPSGKKDIALSVLGTHKVPGVTYDKGAAEIASYDEKTEKLFVVNGLDNVVDVLSLADPAAPVEVDEIAVEGSPNSVDVHTGVVAVVSGAVDGLGVDVEYEPGVLELFDTEGTKLKEIAVGATPDMVTFTPNGDWLLVANEAQPQGYLPGQVDGEGSVTVVDMRKGAAAATARSAGFGSFDGQKAALVASGVRIFGPNRSVSQDLEPEYIAVSHNSKTAWVTLQENNALAEVDIRSAKVTNITALGTKDHNPIGNGLDVQDTSPAVSIVNRKVFGLYMPDSIAALHVKGKTYLLTANEGDVREYAGINGVVSTDEKARVKDLPDASFDPAVFGNAAAVDLLQTDPELGRLNVSSVAGPAGGDLNNDGKREVLYSFGARSLSVWAADKTRTSDAGLIWDGGDQLEQVTAGLDPSTAAPPGVVDDANDVLFNASSTNNTRDNRSDDKGPEPEGIALGKISGRWYAFIGLERVSGIAVYDVSDPTQPAFVEYVDNRDFRNATTTAAAGDLAPEGLEFIDAEDSPNGEPLLVVSNETSGTVTVWQIDKG
jgi:hypothetical protein